MKRKKDYSVPKFDIIEFDENSDIDILTSSDAGGGTIDDATKGNGLIIK